MRNDDVVAMFFPFRFCFRRVKSCKSERERELFITMHEHRMLKNVKDGVKREKEEKLYGTHRLLLFRFRLDERKKERKK